MKALLPGQPGRSSPRNPLSLWLTLIVAGLLFILYQLHWIPDAQLAAAALALLIAYVLYTVPRIRQSEVLLNELIGTNDKIRDRLMLMGSEVTVLKDTDAFYRRLIAAINVTSKVDVTYFTPNVPSEFMDESGKLYWDTINSYLKKKAGFRLRRIATIETAEKLNWLLATVNDAKNPPGYHMHYLSGEYKHTPLNVNIVDGEHAFVFGTEVRSKSSDYIYIRDKDVAGTLQRYFDLLWESTPTLGESGRLNSREIVRLKQKFGIADGSPNPIGVFDSGIGGLSIVREIHGLLPQEDIIYVADQANLPYGDRTQDNVRDISDGIVKFLIDNDVKLVVIACNTATAAALAWLRAHYPNMQFVGTVPAVKPAAEATKMSRIGVLATPATFSTEVYESLVGQYAKDIQIFRYELPGLVNAIEKGDLRTPSTRTLLTEYLKPMISEGVDRIVLGCTHLAFVQDQIREIAGPEVEVIEPSEAIAKQVSNVLQNKGIAKVTSDETKGKVQLFTSADSRNLIRQCQKLGFQADFYLDARWEDGILRSVH